MNFLRRNSTPACAFTGVEAISNLPDRFSFSFCEFGLYLAHSRVFALKIPGTNSDILKATFFLSGSQSISCSNITKKNCL